MEKSVFRKVIRERKADIENSTLENYVNNIRRIHKVLGVDFTKYDLAKYLKSIDNPSMALTLLASITAPWEKI